MARKTTLAATLFFHLLQSLFVLFILESHKVGAGKVFTPLGLKYKVACLAEHLKVALQQFLKALNFCLRL